MVAEIEAGVETTVANTVAWVAAEYASWEPELVPILLAAQQVVELEPTIPSDDVKIVGTVSTSIANRLRPAAATTDGLILLPWEDEDENWPALQIASSQ